MTVPTISIQKLLQVGENLRLRLNLLQWRSNSNVQTTVNAVIQSNCGLGRRVGRQKMEPQRCKTFSCDASIHETVRC